MISLSRKGRKRKPGYRKPSGDLVRENPDKWRLAMYWMPLFRDAMCVYVIEAPSTTKIGKSSNPVMRVDDLQVGNAGRLRLIESFWMDAPEAHKLEAAVHRSLKRTNLHAGGEWYLFGGETAASYVKRVAQKIGVKCYADSEFGRNANWSEAS